MNLILKPPKPTTNKNEKLSKEYFNSKINVLSLARLNSNSNSADIFTRYNISEASDDARDLKSSY
jgi:hypothetical protein